MNLYIISQDVNKWYDTYDSAVVAAPDEDTARRILPDKYCVSQDTWCQHPDQVKVRYIGVAAVGIEQGVIAASRNVR